MPSKHEKVAIDVRGIKKSFRIPLDGGTSLKQKVIHFVNRTSGYRIFTPLNEVSFTINHGEFFGIVGKNGSGKSTLLKTIAGIYAPEEGVVKVNGALVPFIELGVGFNPELTGRENVYLNGALLGFSRDEISEMYDEIVDFAELHDFMEEKLKNYSSGMQVRLAFSIAIQAKGDILLLDEVLAVGDEAFQRKCYAYFDKIKKEKRTVILVTHSMGAVQRFCDRALFLKDGKIEAIGQPDKIAALYSEQNNKAYQNSNGETQSLADVEFKIALHNDKGDLKSAFEENDDMSVRLSWKQEGVNYIGIAIMREDGKYVFGPNMYQDKYRLSSEAKKSGVNFKLNIPPGGYYIKAALFGRDDKDPIAVVSEGPHFQVDKNYDIGKYAGIAQLPYEWVE